MDVNPALPPPEIETPTAALIARRACELQVIFLGLSVSLAVMLDPSLPVLRHLNARMNVADPLGDFPINLFYEPNDRDALSFSARKVLTNMTELSNDARVKDLMTIGMMQGGIRIGDLIIAGQHGRKDVPLLQFCRHFRNACAHGEKWHFNDAEPKYPASVRGRKLNASMHGQPVMWTWMSPRLYAEWLADVAIYFALLAQENGEELQAPASNPPKII